MEVYTETLLDDKGNVISGVTVTVRDTAGAIVDLYEDRLGASVKSNPFTVGVSGDIQFAAADGDYDVVISGVYKGKVINRSIPISLFDPEGDSLFSPNPIEGSKGVRWTDLFSAGILSGGFTPPSDYLNHIRFPTEEFGINTTLAAKEARANKFFTFGVDGELQATSNPSSLSSTIGYKADNYTALKAIDTSGLSYGDICLVSGRSYIGDRGGGTFYWDSSDLSTEVASDTLSGIYVAPTGQDGSLGAWVFIEYARAPWYVDSVTGSDANDGRSPSAAFQNLTALPAVIRPFDQVFLARGSRWRQQGFDLRSDNWRGVEVGPYGRGRLPQIDGSVVAGSFVQNATHATVYEFPVLGNWEISRKYPAVFESNVWLTEYRTGDDGMATDAATIEAVAATPGTFCTILAPSGGYQLCTYYIHPTGSGDPNSNGKLYEVKNPPADDLAGRMVWEDDGRNTGASFSFIHFKRSAQHNGALDTFTVNFKHCVITEIGAHGCITRGGLMEDCVSAFLGPRTGASCFHAHNGGTVANPERPYFWKNCLAIGGEGPTGELIGNGFYTHGGELIAGRAAEGCTAIKVSTCFGLTDVHTVALKDCKGFDFYIPFSTLVYDYTIFAGVNNRKLLVDGCTFIGRKSQAGDNLGTRYLGLSDAAEVEIRNTIIMTDGPRGFWAQAREAQNIKVRNSCLFWGWQSDATSGYATSFFFNRYSPALTLDIERSAICMVGTTFHFNSLFGNGAEPPGGQAIAGIRMVNCLVSGIRPSVTHLTMAALAAAYPGQIVGNLADREEIQFDYALQESDTEYFTYNRTAAMTAGSNVLVGYLLDGIGALPGRKFRVVDAYGAGLHAEGELVADQGGGAWSTTHTATATFTGKVLWWKGYRLNLNTYATTGDIEVGTTSLTLAAGAPKVVVGQLLRIAGVGGVKRVTAVVGTAITIDTAADATVYGARVSFGLFYMLSLYFNWSHGGTPYQAYDKYDNGTLYGDLSSGTLTKPKGEATILLQSPQAEAGDVITIKWITSMIAFLDPQLQSDPRATGRVDFAKGSPVTDMRSYPNPADVEGKKRFLLEVV